MAIVATAQNGKLATNSWNGASSPDRAVMGKSPKGLDRRSPVSQRSGNRASYRIWAEGEMKFDTLIRSIGGLQQEIIMGPHRMVADEPPENGGQDAGPSPFTLLTAALGA